MKQNLKTRSSSPELTMLDIKCLICLLQQTNKQKLPGLHFITRWLDWRISRDSSKLNDCVILILQKLNQGTIKLSFDMGSCAVQMFIISSVTCSFYSVLNSLEELYRHLSFIMQVCKIFKRKIAVYCIFPIELLCTIEAYLIWKMLTIFRQQPFFQSCSLLHSVKSSSCSKIFKRIHPAQKFTVTNINGQQFRVHRKMAI